MAAKNFLIWFFVGIIASNTVIEVTAFGGLFGGGHRGDSGLAEILAAGLVTKLLMEGFGGGSDGQGRSILESIENFAFSSARGPHGYSMGQEMPQHMPQHMMKMPFSPIMQNTEYHPQEYHPQEYHPAEMQLHSRFYYPSPQESAGMMISDTGLHPILAAIRYHGFPFEHMASPSLDLLTLSDPVINDGGLPSSIILGSEHGIPTSMDVPTGEIFEARADEPRGKYILPTIVRHFVDRLVHGTEPRT